MCACTRVYATTRNEMNIRYQGSWAVHDASRYNSANPSAKEVILLFIARLDIAPGKGSDTRLPHTERSE